MSIWKGISKHHRKWISYPVARLENLLITIENALSTATGTQPLPTTPHQQSILASAKVASLDTPSSHLSSAVCMLIYFLLMCFYKLSHVPRVGVLELYA
jgi:hypothetical protein